MINLYAIGGFSEVGKNMSLVEVDDDAFIFDEGLFLPAIVSLQEREGIMTEKKLRSINAIPDDSIVEKIRHKVIAQFVGHAHLDHLGAVPFISENYDAPIYTTPFTAEVLKSLLEDSNINLKNKVYSINPNSAFYVKGKNQKYRVDFINITHSTAQCLLISIETPYGIILYGNDFKIDDSPTFGSKPNYKRLREIAKQGVLLFIVDSLYSSVERKTPSEKIAKELLKEVFMSIPKDSGIIVTTFSSHIARLKSIVEFSQKIDREVVFFGRSLDKYCTAAKNCGIASFLHEIKIYKYRRQIEKMLKKVDRNKSKYVVVCTGHQGEPGSILERISRKELPLTIGKKDNIIFSSSVIPTEVNIEQFSKMESRLKKEGPRIFRDVHVSGHAGREDLREIIEMISPKHIVPSHGGEDKTRPMEELVSSLGYKPSKNIHIMKDGEVLRIKDE